MTVEQAARAYLLTVSAVTTIVSTRIYQLKLPQTPTLPALRLQLIDEPEEYQLRGEAGARSARLQIDVYGSESVADPYAAVTDLADVVKDALSGQVITQDGLRLTGWFRVSRRVGYEAETLRLVRCTQDFRVWVKEL